MRSGAVNNHKAMTPSRRSESFPRSPLVESQQQQPSSSFSSSIIDDKTLLLLDSIASKQSCLMNLSLTLTVYVPSACVGALIGRKGATMVDLQTFAAKHSTTSQPVRIFVVHGTNQQQQDHSGSNSTNHSKTAATATAPEQQHYALPSSSIPTHTPPDLFNPHWTPVVVKADAKACLAAGLAVQSHVAAAAAVASAASSSNHHHNECDNYIDDDVVLDVPVARTKHSAMVGKRGVLLANASADFNVRIMVPAKQTSGSNHNMNVIQLEGKLVNVISCLERLMSIAVTIKGTVNNNNTVAAATTKKQGNTAAASTPSGTSPETAVESNDGPAPLHQHQATITLAVCPALAKVRSIVRKTDTIVKRKQVPAASNAPLASEEAMVDEETINDADNATTDSKVTSSTAVFSWELTVSGNTHESVQAAVDLLQAASATAHPAPKPLWHRRRRPANKPKGNGK